MKQYIYLLILIPFFIALSLPLEAQNIDRKLLTWEQKTIHIGAVLEEKGPVETTFYALNSNREGIIITDVITDCGCTTVNYSKDTLHQEQIASVQVRFDPDHRGGEFSKVIIVRTNQDIYGDTLYLEGINMPVAENVEMAYPIRKGQLGFRLPGINLGNVFTNEPKIRYVEVHNFGKEEFSFSDMQPQLPDYLTFRLEPERIPSGQRGVLVVNYDGQKKNDLGFFDENIKLNLSEGEELELRIIAVVYEYFAPIPKSMENIVPRLTLSENEVDLKEVSAGRKVQRNITLSNQGQDDLVIRKITGNCDCLSFNLSNKMIRQGARANLEFEFDTKGRRGIDHKHITIFSNDPINPVRTITIKSNIK
ncbi:DUF1573 domain-containing protein [Cecembia rubra]|uniref:DUF1573 domain-containing protein n=1 Tax=Cecembia rubra TaxID=1485585 RepID=UPI002714C2F8|nr:DUF1573 domain-containing protein [Cecembia rubra]